jgi:predicted site-specific integrase-resolvase
MNIIEKMRLKKKIVRAIIYARFSSDNQREESIDAQIRAIKEYARRNDIIVVGEKVASESLAKKLTELEADKIKGEAEFNDISYENEMHEITVEKLTDNFMQAR